MHLHSILALSPFLVSHTTGLKAVTFHGRTEPGAAVSPGLFDAAEVPHLSVGLPLQYTRPGRFRSHFSPLAARASEEGTTNLSRRKELRLMGFNVVPESSSELPSGPEPAANSHGSSGPQPRPVSTKRPSRPWWLKERPKTNWWSVIKEQRPDLLVKPGSQQPDGKKRQKIPRVDRDGGEVMYHEVVPDPNNFQGVQDVATGRQYYYRKISDSPDTQKGLYSKLRHAGSANPTQSTSITRGHKRKYPERRYLGSRPAKYEAVTTTGIRGYGSFPGWYRMHPKMKHQLPPHVQPWTNEELRNNLVRQGRHFLNHQAGNKDSKYARLDKEMRSKCVVEQCNLAHTPQARRYRKKPRRE